MTRAADHKPWFGVEQMFAFSEPSGKLLGWPSNNLHVPAPQGPYYCGIGPDRIRGRRVLEAAVRAMLDAGVKVAGHNIGAAPNQFEIQIGICEGIEMGDHLWIARYILLRVAEEHDLCVTFHPTPYKGTWNSSGGQTNFSTESMRKDNGLGRIEEGIEKLSHKHQEHIAVYDPLGGEYNKLRLTGSGQTSSVHNFSWDNKTRDGTSVRIPLICLMEQKGYFEDRRPCSNADPYQVTSRVVKTICLDE